MRFLPCLTALLLTLPVSSHAEVRITGIENADALDNFRNFLSLGRSDCDTPQWKVEQQFRLVDTELQKALRPFGYYHASASSKLDFTEQCWTALIRVTQGPPVILRESVIRIEGEAGRDPGFESKLAAVRPYIGEPLQHSRYEKVKQVIQSTALDRGYLEGRFQEKSLRVNIDSNEAEILLVFDSGPRFHFGQVQIDQDVLDPDFIQRIIQLEPGTPYSSSQLISLRSSLNNSGYFSNVSVTPDLDDPLDKQVPVTVSLSPSKKHHFSAGVGFDTDIGPMLNGSYTNRRVNRSGHSFSTSIQLSPVESGITASYNIPLDKPDSDKLGFAIGYNHEDTDSYESDKFTLTTSLSQTLANSWKQTLYTDLSQESYEADDEDRENSILFIPGARWSQTIVDNVLRPADGHMMGFEIKGSHESVISDVSFIQLKTQGALIQQIAGGGTFIGRSQLGMTLVSDFEKLPTSQRFFAGGASTIRGYQYKELGPADNNGDVVGGRFLAIASAEYEHPVFQDWGVAGFVDTGNAFNENRVTIKTGVGGGVRWYSPIGPVRLDLAFPLNDSDSSFQIHFATGPRW